MGTFLARSGSFNNLKVTNLASSSKANIVAIDSASGQLFYMSTASFGGGSGGPGTPGGLNKQIQFNSGSTFSGSSNFTYDYVASNLIYNGVNGYGFQEFTNNPNDYTSSVLIGIGLTGSKYVDNQLTPNSIILGTYNQTNSVVIGDPSTYNLPTFIVGNGFVDVSNPPIRSNALEIGMDYSSLSGVPFIKLPQLTSLNTGYVVTVDSSTKQLYYSAFTTGPGGSDKQIQFNNNNVLAGATGFNYITGSSNVLQFTGSFVVSSSLNVVGTSRVTGSLSISGSEYIKGSGSAIFKTDGTVGPLFTVNDSNSGSLFTVNDISGMPILDVRSDGSTLIGSSTAPSLNTTKKVVSTGVQAFALGGTLIPTASYDSAFFEYMAKSGSNARSGYITATWSGSMIVSSSITSSDIGTTTGLTTFAAISSSYIVLSGSANAANWTVKSIIRAI
jgi:hypothetical protein